MNEVNERIKQVINKYYNGNESALCRDAAIGQSTLNGIILGKRNPSMATIQKIANARSVKINAGWLLTGIGVATQEEEGSVLSQKQPVSREADERDIMIRMLQEQLERMSEELKDYTGKNAVLKYMLELKEQEELKKEEIKKSNSNLLQG